MNQHKYEVYVADNYEYMSESKFPIATFDSVEEAVEYCKKFVERDLESMYEPGITPDKLSTQWAMFGEGPFIRGCSTEGIPFSARSYVTYQLCERIISKLNIDIPMIYTPRMIDAIHFAIEVHQLTGDPQYRKGKSVPYVTHPLTVALILSQAGAREEVVIAGILHDVIEDCEPYGSVTKDMLAERFGAEVASLVDSVSEKNKALGWHERKEQALEEIRQFSHESLLVKSGDVISNNTELIRDYEADGAATFERFNADPADIVEHGLLVIDTILETWPENPLAGDLTAIKAKVQEFVVSGA